MQKFFSLPYKWWIWEVAGGLFASCVSAVSETDPIFCFPSLFQLYINRKCNFSITLQVLLNQFGHFTVICQHRRTYSAKISPHSSCLAKGMQDDKHISGADPTEMNWASVALWKHWLPVLKVHLDNPDCLQNICDHHRSSAKQWWWYMGKKALPLRCQAHCHTIHLLHIHYSSRVESMGAKQKWIHSHNYCLWLNTSILREARPNLRQIISLR